MSTFHTSALPTAISAPPTSMLCGTSSQVLTDFASTLIDAPTITAVDGPGGSTTSISGTVLPTSLACGLDDITGGLERGVGVSPVNNQTWPQILHCCNGEPITIWQADGCFAWCEAGSGQLNNLKNCYFQPNGTMAPGLDNVACEDSGLLLNGTAGPSVETCGVEAAGTTTIPPLTATTSPSATNPAASSSTQTGTASAIRPRSIGKAEIALVSLVALSLLSGMML